MPADSDKSTTISEPVEQTKSNGDVKPDEATNEEKKGKETIRGNGTKHNLTSAYKQEILTKYERQKKKKLKYNVCSFLGWNTIYTTVGIIFLFVDIHK